MCKSESDSKWVDLEIKLTYLDDLVQELNKIIYNQQKSIDGLEQKNKQLILRMEELEQSPKGADLPHEKPPHY